jgi:dTDP-4-dehydrorhamnose reductase
VKKVLLLGCDGKVGTAVRGAFAHDHLVVCKGRGDFDAADLGQVERLVRADGYDIVVNAVAFVGIDRCEQEPVRAFAVNALFPGRLAALSTELGFILVHFSSDAVFSGRSSGCYLEEDCPQPINMYGTTKHAGDCLVQAEAGRHYLIRISLLFGESAKDGQFVEKMLSRARQGQKRLDVSADIVCSPSYSRDIALRLRELIAEAAPYGLYHLANEGRASLYELMREILTHLPLDVELRPVSHRDFPSVGRKNTWSVLRSQKIRALQPWREAVRQYCAVLNSGR